MLGEYGWPGGPCREFFPMRARVDLIAEQRHVFAQIEAWSQLIDALLASVNFRDRRRRQQPRRQSLLAGLRPRSRKQFEQRAFAEQVEVFRIRVRLVGESLARLAAAAPVVFEPRDAA